MECSLVTPPEHMTCKNADQAQARTTIEDAHEETTPAAALVMGASGKSIRIETKLQLLHDRDRCGKVCFGNQYWSWCKQREELALSLSLYSLYNER